LACTAHLAFVFVHTLGACLVLVASLPPKRGELLPHQTSFEGRLILADSYSLNFALARDHAPRLLRNFLEVPEFLEICARVVSHLFFPRA
jgi:hypothetical protein